VAERQPAAAAVRGAWWRHSPAGLDPWSRPPVAPSARWQRGEVSDALYFADSPDTAWAEWYRQLAEAALPPLEGLPRDLWRWRIDLERVADLREETALAALGLGMPRPDRREWPAFQQAGERLVSAGWRALVAPSAARPEGFVLCVFLGEGRPSGLDAEALTERVTEPPAPPRGLTT
jgi:RES domain-containing protein